MCLYLDSVISFLIIGAKLLYWISSPCDDLHLHFTLDDIQYYSAPPCVRLLKYNCTYDWIVGELGLYIAEIKLQGSYTIISRSSSVLRNVGFVYEVARWAFVL